MAERHAEYARKKREEKLQVGKLSYALMTQIEYLAMNGHDRIKLQNEYSIRQIFFYSDMVQAQNRKKQHDESIVLRTVIQAAQTGNNKAFDVLLQNLKK